LGISVVPPRILGYERAANARTLIPQNAALFTENPREPTFVVWILRQVAVFTKEHFYYPSELNLPQVAETKPARLMDVTRQVFLYAVFMVASWESPR
jgi:hypothetical protein